MKALIAASVLLLTLSACSLTGPSGAVHEGDTWNPQQYGGCNHATGDLNGDGNNDFFVIGCKEQDEIRIEVTFSETGQVNGVVYEAGGVRALPAFESRADVEKWVAEKHGAAVEALTPAMQSIVDSLVSVFLKP